MSQLWLACAEAGPLATLPQEKLEGVCRYYHAFYRTFRCFRRILRHQHTTLELYHEFQQTWDECNDFLRHNPDYCDDLVPQTTRLHETACYVYNDLDLDHLAKRVELQLHIMNAKMDDIMLTQRPIPYLRRRVYTYVDESDLATLQLDSYETEECLYTVDIVTHSSDRWIVSTKEDKEWGVVQHLPPINRIHPYTKHQRFDTSEIRLFEACIIDQSDGSVTWRYEGRKPAYRFNSLSDAFAFECALRGKILLHTFQVEEISSERGLEGTAQPVKLWCDFDDRNRALSFLVQRSRPYFHLDVPLRMFGNIIHANNATNKVRVEFWAPKVKKKALRNPNRLLRRLSNLIRHAPPDYDEVLEEHELRFQIMNVLAEEELPESEAEFINSMSFLRFEFSTSDDAVIFQETLTQFFTEKLQMVLAPAREISISRENSENASSGPSDPSSGLQGPYNHPASPTRLRSSTHILATGSEISMSPTNLSRPILQMRPVENGSHASTDLPGRDRRGSSHSSEIKDLDYRVRGISLEYTGNDLLKFLERKLDLEPNITGRIKSLATGPAGDKVAVIAWRPRPACFSTPNQDEWEFGPTSDDDKMHITIDTHFRGLSVLYTPPDDIPPTVDICAVAGLGGHAWGSFKHKGTSQSFMWILDGLREHFPTARLMTYGSKTKLDGNESTQTLEDLGRILRDDLLGDLGSASSRVGKSFSVPSFFIAHSLGGLTVKEALLQELKAPEPESFINNVQGALFFGVPNHGMNVEVLEAMIRGQPNEALLNSIGYQSTTLQKLSRDFKSEYRKRNLRKPTIIYLYEMEPSFSPLKLDNGQWKMAATPKKILVDRDSATDGKLWSASYDNIHPLNRNHSDLVKFSSPNDADFQRVVRILVKLLKTEEGCDKDL
ncbi:hypothetical protein N7462_008673 [Penicillium macrosclerotiorum]|uniref:uncharacterized protein n=1 Tax=Penicillium macrosclerotiorum TaxID=303699 RepID=UPI0025485CBA|nr:uncharacterized protein N7462_008673 [Penicillium macrosclerotiorum]KAJ5675776.1 hypothetical protein N7462_008673 [Penicillium macrosclerotiorum]